MPPQGKVTFPLLKQVFKGEKKLLITSQVNICNPPRYDEISVKVFTLIVLNLDKCRNTFRISIPKVANAHENTFSPYCPHYILNIPRI